LIGGGKQQQHTPFPPPPPQYHPKRPNKRPPGIYAYNASAAKSALSLEAQGALSRGFWTHGLWPSSARRAPGTSSPSTPRQNWCEGGGGGSGSSTGNVTEAALGPDLVSALDYWMPNPTRANFTEADNLQWWSREYQKHGSCTGMGPKEFFTIVTTQAAVKNPAVLAALAAGGVSPSNERTFAAADALAALRAAFGGAVAPGSLVCATDNQARVTLQEVELCLDADTLAPCDCHTG
jgi:ribonuclease I